MGHYFSYLMDDEVLRCEECGVNYLSPRAKQLCPYAKLSQGYAKLELTKGNKMITLTFETWEEFDNAIAGIVSLETELTKESN